MSFNRGIKKKPSGLRSDEYGEFSSCTMKLPTHSQYCQNIPGKKEGGASWTSTVLNGFQFSRSFLFSWLNLALKERIWDIPDIRQDVTRLLNIIPKKDFMQSSQDGCCRVQRCIDVGGNNFEGQIGNCSS